LEITRPRNQYHYDARSPDGQRIEIKHRFFSTRTPPGMKIDLEKIDSVLYVDLDENLLPRRIFKIEPKDLEYTTGKRVSFQKAFKENKVKMVYQNSSTPQTF
jgi:hypothetical protein